MQGWPACAAGGMIPDGYAVPEQQPVRPSVPQFGGASRDIGKSSLRVDVVEQDPDLRGAHAPTNRAAE